MTTQLSKTTITLLNATKKLKANEKFSYEFLKEVLVGPIGPDLSIRDCLRVVINTVMAMRRESRFEMPYGNNERNDLMFEIIFAPLNLYYGNFTHNKETTFLEVYESMIVKCLNYIRLSRVDWCKDQLSLE